MTAKIIDGKAFATNFCNELKQTVQLLKAKHNVTPGLAVILVGDDPASHVYVKNKIIKAREIGINIFDFVMPAATSVRIIKAKIENLNNDQRTHGLLVQLPLPQGVDQYEVIDTIDPAKDVDGFTTRNIGLLHSSRDCLEPSTPQGCLKLIKSVMGEDLSGKKAVVVGRSIIVGRPMATMLLRENCTVTTLHSKSFNIAEECRSADILIAATGQKEMITADLVKPGACVIDIGITRHNGQLFGDVKFDEVKEVAGFITPVPGGVGPMTVACMLGNTIKAACNQKKIKL
jgi:methylenetetrahydrofolate dehydrogenase (NADP+)/methenyltetrahydrofolate cyclohydrolase